MAEIEIGILSRQCLDRARPDRHALQTEVDHGNERETQSNALSNGASLDKMQTASLGVIMFHNLRVDVLVRQKGSHRQYHHTLKSGTVTVAGKDSVEIPPGTLNSILKQAGLKK